MIESLLAACAPAEWLPGLVASAGSLGLPATLFVVGLIGGFFHCVGMCGPFVLAQAAKRPELRRLDERLFLPYHLGRSTTYVLLGALAGGTSGAFAVAMDFKAFAALLLAVGAVYFASQALRSWGLRLALPALPGNGLWGGFVGKTAAPLLRGRSALSGYVLGLVLGLLPCGLLWGAIAVAAGTGRASAGAMALAAFAVGTVPALAAVGWAGTAAGKSLRAFAAQLAPPLLLLNAVFLLYFAWRALG